MPGRSNPTSRAEGFARVLFLVAVVAGAIAFAPDAAAQVLRRDPSVTPADLDIHGRFYKPYGQASFGLFRFHPFASLEGTWDDNIFQEPSYEKEDDFVFEKIAGVRTDWRLGRHETLLGYQLNHRNWCRHASENVLEHRADLLSLWNFDWFFLDLGDRFEQRRDPEPAEIDIISERSRNDAWVRTGLYVERIGFEAEYRLRWFDFVDPNLGSLDRTEHYATLGAYYLLREDSTLAQELYAFLEVTCGAFRFRERVFSDSNHLSAMIGAKGSLFDRMAFSLKIGYAGLDPVRNGVVNEEEDFRGPVYEATVVYQPEEQHKASLSAYRRLQVSLGSDFRVFDRIEAAYQYRFDNFLFDDLFVRLHAFLEHADPSRSRSFTRAGAGLSLEYFLQDWLSMGTGWEFAQRTARRDPALPSLNYRNHRISFHFTAYF